MAEPIGLALGVAGLAGLFSNVIDCFEYIHIGKTFGGNFQTSLLKLDNAMLRLSRWGEAVGLSGRIYDASALPSWIKPEEKKLAEKTLGQILNLFDSAEKEAAKFKSGKSEQDASLDEYNDDNDLDASAKPYHQIMREVSVKRQNRTKLSTKFKFAVYSESHLKGLIDDITSLTDSLMNLFPGRPELEEKQKQLCSNEVKEFTNSLKELADMIKDNDKVLAIALAEVLKPAVSL
jgi:hypothetical protein